MRPIPPRMREEMSNDPFMKVCCLSMLGNCEGVIEWHHEIQFAGRQLSEKWAILPVCHFHHDQARNSFIKERLQWIALNRATEDELKAVTKAINYIGLKERLNRIYGKI